jgi:uncharacterized MAPEG superfamily protein
MTGTVALIYFAALTLTLMFIAVNYRVFKVLTGTKADSWGRINSIEKPGWVIRMEHAHLNCLESLPVFGAIVLASVVMNKTAVVDALACWVISARVAQSVTHLIGVNHWLVLIRATFFTAQVLMFFYLMWALVCSAA